MCGGAGTDEVVLRAEPVHLDAVLVDPQALDDHSLDVHDRSGHCRRLAGGAQLQGSTGGEGGARGGVGGDGGATPPGYGWRPTWPRRGLSVLRKTPAQGALPRRDARLAL